MCSSSLQRKTSRLYRCKRKKENQGPRRKYERNNVCRVPSRSRCELIFIHTKLRRVSMNNLRPLFLPFFLARVFPSFFCSYRGEDASLSLVSRAHHSLSPFTPSIAISHTACPLDFLLYISAFSFSLSLSFSLMLSLSFCLSFILIHTFALIEYNSYVITGGRHPMSISSGMRDERFSPLSS